ncbi:hypothetical protein HPB50_017898 [Hyalomma asiaticum]|uniref:Uncharacterized protein n=1 Tax=Hyalomma asiaticum TaxID=266040 RepID=A0ACB7T528_HYAAI|nr:hypothetical protein HPB50_017898 [Hyalomma asiaticum]
MPIDQDWASVWPTAQSFRPSVVPLPLRQGYRERGAPPGKFANLELMKVPNFLHLTPVHLAKHAKVLRPFCTPWPAGLETDEKCEEHFPVEVIDSDYCHASPSIRDPRCRIVTLRVKLSNLELDYHARDKLLRLVGDRYDPATDVLTIVTDRCPLKKQNYEYAHYLLTAVYHESWKTEPWEADKAESDMECFLWERSRSEANAVGFVKRMQQSLAGQEEITHPHVQHLPPDCTDDDINGVAQVKDYAEAVCEIHNEGESVQSWDNGSWRRVVPTPRALTLFLVLVGFGLVLFIYLPRSFEERLVRSPRRRIPVLLAYEGEAEVHTFFCDTHTTQCPRVEFTPASGWQGGIPGVPDLHLLSAHYDTRVWVHGGKNRHYVRLLGVIKSEDADSLRFFCQMWYQELPRPIVVESDRIEIWLPAWDGRAPPGRYYRPFIFSCPVPFNVSSPFSSGPANVSLVAEPCACPPNSLTLSRTPEKDPKRGIAVCVKGLDFPEDISARLVEWLELQFLLGADTVFFYIFQVHPKVDLILRYYRRFRRVQFERIQLPGLDEPHIPAKRRQYLANNTWQKRRHELVPYNDCYYRHIPTHEFVLLVDIDEVVLPRRHATWQELLDDIVSASPKMLSTYASLAVPNVYFFDHFVREKSWSWFLSRITRSA